MQGVNNLFNDIRYLKGVGPKKALDFNRLGVNNPRDLLYLFPRRYQDRSEIKKISELNPLDTALIRGEVRAAYLRRSRRNVPIYEAVVDDGSSIINISWFSQPYLKNIIKKGSDVILYGKVEFYKGLRMNSPDYEVLNSREPELGIVAVYPLSGRLTQRFIRNLVKDQLEINKERIREFMPEDIIRRYSIMNRFDALFNLHYPDSLDSAKEARLRLIFEDIFITQLAIAIKRVKRKRLKQGRGKFSPYSISDFKRYLSFELTDSQQRVLKIIEKDMLSNAPMNRLVQGEVGSGKTVIAAYSSLLAASGGHQAAIMVPTEILAQQQYVKISEMLSDFNTEVGLLTGDMDRDSRRDTVERIYTGKIAVVVGTHALLQRDIRFKSLSLVIVDEQHKFGVQQRRTLREKGSNPDYLVMTATPIPRTLALTVFGDMDISTIKEMPFGDKRINTYWVDSSKRSKVRSFLKEEIDGGSQGFVICPRIEDSEDSLLRDVETVYEELKALLGADRVELLHGKMNNDEKNRVVARFKKRQTSVLVSTVVVEVGIDIPDASIIIIEDADRFGLSQLHQLRGRVGRASQDAYCILLADPKTEESYSRLNIMAETGDGFRISEEDLKIRGSGEVLGLKQHGFISNSLFQIASENRELLERARDEVEIMLRRDPLLKDIESSPLYRELKSRFKSI
jgi:ATP-dependent DNA helicase RecG